MDLRQDYRERPEENTHGRGVVGPRRDSQERAIKGQLCLWERDLEMWIQTRRVKKWRRTASPTARKDPSTGPKPWTIMRAPPHPTVQGPPGNWAKSQTKGHRALNTTGTPKP